MKKIFITLAFCFIAHTALAADWYIRSDGSDSTNCTGHTDAAYPGSGTGQACAFNHISWLLGSGGTTNLMSGGDAVYFGKAAEQYVIGYPDMPNIGYGICGAGNPYDCHLNAIPGGSSSSARTKIYGYGYADCASKLSTEKTQLWGENRVSEVLLLETGGNHFDIQCLDITDHSACMENGPLDGNIDGFPVQCVRTTYPQGPWALQGLQADTTGDVNLTNVDIHGLASKGILGVHNADWTLTNSKIISNSYVGWDSDGPTSDDSYTGTTTLQNNTKVDWNGCGERYPLQSSDLDSSSNRHHCYEQTQNGYGDGIGLGDGDPGNWTVTDSSISWNTSDGLDLAHSLGANTTIKVSRSRLEGNNGNALKLTAKTGYVENNLIIANCGFFYGQTFTSTKDIAGNNADMNWCRSVGGQAVIFNMASGVNYYLSGNTILGNTDVIVNSNGTDCTNAHIYGYNNIVYGGRQFTADTSINPGGDNDTPGYYFRSGSGSCSSLAFTNDYNIVYGTKNVASDTDCTNGAHNQCNVDPLFTGTIKQGPYSSPGYYTTADYYKQLHIPNSAPAVGANSADETITLIGASDDVSATARGAQWDCGAYEYGSPDWTGAGSCIANGAACAINGDCCSTYCCSLVCSASACGGGGGGGGGINFRMSITGNCSVSGKVGF